MTFDEWWKANGRDFGEHLRRETQIAYEAGMHADVHTDNSAVIAELEESLAEWWRTCEAKSDTNAQLIKQLADKNEENAELKESVDFWEERYWILNDVYKKVVNENKNKLAKAKRLLAFWVNDFYDVSSSLSKYKERHEVLVETEQFLKEMEK